MYAQPVDFASVSNFFLNSWFKFVCIGVANLPVLAGCLCPDLAERNPAGDTFSTIAIIRRGKASMEMFFFF